MRTRHVAAVAVLVACGGTSPATTAAAIPAKRADTPGCRNDVTTDDAQVDADVVPVATRVGGVIRHMAITDNQHVDAGAVIAEIDDADYAARLAAAQAELEAAMAQAEAADAQVEIQKSTSAGGLSSAKAQRHGASVRIASTQVDSTAASVARAKAELAKAELDYARAKKLHDARAVSDQLLDAAQVSRDAAQAAVDAANAEFAVARDADGRVQQSTPVDRQVAAATAAGKLAHAHVQSAQAALDLAKLQLQYTRITAPLAGVVSKLGAHEGQLVQPGMTLLMVVPAKTYVIASFKETQMDRITPGDPVEISIDALGGRVLHGKVDSISADTGARLPPDNVPGKFVKIVQRVPVKIVWNDGQDLAQLRVGFSAELKVCPAH